MNTIVGQIQGPFLPGENVADIINNGSAPKYSKIGIEIGEKDFFTYVSDFIFEINNVEIHMGRTQKYELDEDIYLRSLTFRDGAPASTKVDYAIVQL